MTRKSILERLDARADELAPDTTIAEPPSPVHAATVAVLGDLLTMGERLSGDTTPPHLRILMRTLHASRPMLLDSIAGVPAESIKHFMADLGARIQTIVDA